MNNKQRSLAIKALIPGMVCAVFLIWFFLIQPQHAGLELRESRLSEARTKLQSARTDAKSVEQIKTDLDLFRSRLEIAEYGIAKGDPYRWMLKTVETFPTPAGLKISDIEPPEIGESNRLPILPYKTAVYSLQGTGHYHTFGTFLANFENAFPYVRIQRLELEPVDYANTPSERLRFKLTFTVLLKPKS